MKTYYLSAISFNLRFPIRRMSTAFLIAFCVFLTLEQPVSAASGVVVWGGGFLSHKVPAGLTDVKSVAAGEDWTLALKEDGTIIAWGDNSEGQISIPTGLTGVKAIAAGYSHSVALKGDGTVIAWGSNWDGETTVPAEFTGAKAIAAGRWHTVALKADGTVVAWGSNLQGQTTVQAGLVGVKAIAAGDEHTVALKEDGTVVAWGYNKEGQTTVPEGLSGVKAIAAGSYHTVALKEDGTVVAWGYNKQGQTTIPEGLSGVKAIAAGSYHTVALKEDGTVVAWGSRPAFSPRVPAGLSGVKAIATRGEDTVALVDFIPVPDITVRKRSKDLKDGKSTIAFGSVKSGTKKQIDLNIKNKGLGTLYKISVNLSGGNKNQFKVTVGDSWIPGCGGSWATGVGIIFKPTGSGLRTTTLRITSNDPNENPFEIKLVGTSKGVKSLGFTSN